MDRGLNIQVAQTQTITKERSTNSITQSYLNS
jgi:hypothetical protein